MKRLLTLLCLVGAAVYLLAPPRAVPVNDDVAVAQAHVYSDQSRDVPLRTSWGSTLNSLKQNPDPSVETEEVRSYRQAASYGERPNQVDQAESDLPQPATVDLTKSVDDLATATTGAIDQEAKQWARVTLAATLYREPSLSSPVAGYSSPGTEVRILEYNNGWFRVQDPASQKSGWAYYKSLEYIHGPTAAPAQVAAVDEPAVKPASNAVSPASPKPARIAQPAVRVSDDREVIEPRDFRSAERASHRKVAETTQRRRGFGLFKRRQERRAWALGPSN